MEITNFYNAVPESNFIYFDLIRSLLYGLLLYGILIFHSLYLKKKDQCLFLAFVTGAFLLRIAFFSINETFHLIPQKHAGNFALWYYVLMKEEGLTQFLSANLNTTFFPQILFNFLGFELFGGNRINMLLVNSFFSVLSGVMAFHYLKKYFGTNTGFIGLGLFLFYPAAINFSGFGLRDPINFFFISAICFLIIDFVKRASFIKAVILPVVILFSFVSRPEAISFILFPIFILGAYYLYPFFKKKASESRKLFVGYIFFSSILLLVLLYGVYWLTIMGYGGANELVSPIEFLDTYVNKKFEADNTGSPGSNILPEDIYLETHWALKWILQSITIIILPLPWLIDDVWKLFAFFDSLFVIYLMSWFFITRKRKIKGRVWVNTFFFAFLLAVIVGGTILFNAGNAFRIRLSFMPYLLTSSALLFGAIGQGFSEKFFKKINNLI